MIFTLGFSILLLILNYKSYIFSESKALAQKSELTTASQVFPFSKGEKIIYNVALFGIKIGQAQLQFLGKTNLNNKVAELIILSTDVNNLKDVEKIYVDSNSFLPLRIERDVVFFGKKMRIIEEYNMKENSLMVSKTEGGKTTKKIFQSFKPMQNIISLIFMLRKSKSLEIGQKISVVTPLLNFDMKVAKLVNFSTANDKFKAYFLESSPKRYRIWIDQGARRIPLRVDGAIAFGNAAMVMTKFIPGEN